MYQRFKRSLIKPSELGMYIKDSWLRIWVYFFLLLVVGIFPFLLIIYATPGLNNAQIQNVSSNFVENLQSNYTVVDNSLVIPLEEQSLIRGHEFDLYAISISHAPRLSGYQQVSIHFSKEYVQFFVSIYLVKTYTYSDLNLNGFSFNDYSSQNIDRFIRAINYMVIDNQVPNKLFQTTTVLINYAIEYLFFIIFSIFLSRVALNFSIKFKIAVYALTIYVVFGLFSVLFNLGILSFVGIIFLVIYLNKAFTRIVVY